MEKYLKYWCSVKKGEHLQNSVGTSVKCFASINTNLLESSFLGLFVCLLGLVEVLWASSLGCRTEFLAEVKLGTAISSVGNWALYRESIFCAVSSLQFLCSINNTSDSSIVALCWGQYLVCGDNYCGLFWCRNKFCSLKSVANQTCSVSVGSNSCEVSPKVCIPERTERDSLCHKSVWLMRSKLNFQMFSLLPPLFQVL